jgi:hypothetical protein
MNYGLPLGDTFRLGLTKSDHVLLASDMHICHSVIDIPEIAARAAMGVSDSTETIVSKYGICLVRDDDFCHLLQDLGFHKGDHTVTVVGSTTQLEGFKALPVPLNHLITCKCPILRSSEENSRLNVGPLRQ